MITTESPKEDDTDDKSRYTEFNRNTWPWLENRIDQLSVMETDT